MIFYMCYIKLQDFHYFISYTRKTSVIVCIDVL